MIHKALRRRGVRLAMPMLLVTGFALALAYAGGAIPAGPPPQSPVHTIAGAAMPISLTASAPAIVEVALPAQRKPDALLEVTVRPEAVSPDEAYLVNVAELCGASGEPKPLGSFSFFPPPVKGRERAFLIPAPTCAAAGTTARVRLEMIPAEPGDTLTVSAVSIVSARIAE